MKKVIFKDFWGYKVTDEQNYNAQIQNVNKITSCHNFSSPQQIIEYFCKYGGCNKDDFIIKV